jgi:hypothetical protein
MSDKPPPFANYLPVTSQDIWEKLLAGDLAAHIYNSEARGNSGPVSISAAEFFLADEARAEQEYGFSTQLRPFQILWRDRDPQRPAATRRGTRVPHWVYVKKAAPQAEPVTELKKERGQAKVKTPTAKQRAIGAAISACFPKGVPQDDVMEAGPLCTALQQWLKANRQGVNVSDKTILRVVRRAK